MKKPNFTVEAQNFLETVVSGATVLEYGSGYSTEWLAHHANYLVSIEHNRDWFDRIAKALSDKNITCEIDYILADRPYHREHVQSDKGLFDVVIIDGRDRVACLDEVIEMNLVKPGGVLFFDDVQRNEYAEGVARLDELGWEKYVTCDQPGDPTYCNIPRVVEGNGGVRHTIWWIRPLSN